MDTFKCFCSGIQCTFCCICFYQIKFSSIQQMHKYPQNPGTGQRCSCSPPVWDRAPPERAHRPGTSSVSPGLLAPLRPSVHTLSDTYSTQTQSKRGGFCINGYKGFLWWRRWWNYTNKAHRFSKSWRKFPLAGLSTRLWDRKLQSLAPVYEKLGIAVDCKNKQNEQNTFF